MTEMESKCVHYTRDEVVIHNSPDDIWVIVNDRVFDLKNLVLKRSESMNDVSKTFLKFFQWNLWYVRLQCLRLLVQFAGKDLSWCFNERGEPLQRINQHGNSLPVFPPAYEKESEDSEFWWRNIIGKITCIERRIRIINTLTRKTISMNVCDEDSIFDIQRKYAKRFNRNAGNYVWRKTSSHDKSSGRLNLEKTLTQNGILYQKNEKLGLPPAIWLFHILNKD